LQNYYKRSYTQVGRGKIGKRERGSSHYHEWKGNLRLACTAGCHNKWMLSDAYATWHCATGGLLHTALFALQCSWKGFHWLCRFMSQSGG